MDFDATFPLKLYLNLTKHDERRREVENELLDAGIDDYERAAAYPGKWVGSWRGYPTANRYAQALSHKRAVWTGWRRGAAAVVVFEDDVVFAPGFKQKFAELELPDDWGIFYFGCQHRVRPSVVAPGVVRCGLTWDMHAYAVRASVFREVARALTPLGKGAREISGTGLHSCDAQVARLWDRIPVYAAWPNLAWQRRSISEAQHNWLNDNYTPEGRQINFPEAVEGVDEEMRERFGGSHSSSSPAAKLGGSERERFLFCRSGADVGLGSRLAGLASLRLLAKLMGQTVCLWWPGGETKQPGHEGILEPSGYRCLSDEREWRHLTQGVAPVERVPSTLMPEAVIELARRRGLAGGSSDEELLALWHRLARDLRPSRVVHSRVTAAVEGWRARRPLGLHVGRTGGSARGGHGSDPQPDEPQNDCGGSGAAEDDERTRQRLLGLWREGAFDAVFLACDDPERALGWIDWFEAQSIRVLGSNRVWRAGRVHQPSLEDAAVDLFLLGRCDRIVATAWSEFSWMASVIGQAPYEPQARPSVPG